MTDPHIAMGTRRPQRDGYPALATWMAQDVDYEGFMFRRFDRLAARNILNLQSRPLEIESAVDELYDESRRGGDARLKGVGGAGRELEEGRRRRRQR